MLKHVDDIRKSARGRATRKWRNHDLQQRLKEEKKKAEFAPKQPKELEPADVIENNKKLNGNLIRVQTKFAKDIRAMLEGHADRNTVLYILSLQAKKKKLLAEKLRRLRAAQEAQT